MKVFIYSLLMMFESFMFYTVVKVLKNEYFAMVEHVDMIQKMRLRVDIRFSLNRTILWENIKNIKSSLESYEDISRIGEKQWVIMLTCCCLIGSQGR